jgi:TRAP-type C4-dicarboxylate transport system substrate-binding protein
MKALRILLFLALVAAPAPAAGKVTVKFATLAPDGSVWHKILDEMAHDWRAKTDGRVRVRLYAGGVAGDDPDMVRKMNIRQLHAAALTVAGLSEIDPAFEVFSTPLFFDSPQEFFFVLQGMEPELKRRIEAKGYHLLHWAHGGWVHFFVDRPVATVGDLKRVKLFTWAGDDRMAEVWKSCGFRPIVLASTDILTGLQTGMIEGLPTTPLAALSLQWYKHTPVMLTPGMAPLVGGSVISKRIWERISEGDRALLLESARRAQERLVEEIPGKDAEAVEEMRKRGLEVLPLDLSDPTWREAADQLAGKMRASMVPEEIYRMALRHRDAYRERKKNGGSQD